MTADDIAKAQAAVGITIVEIVKKNGQWTMDPTGKKVLGTFNNCANGETPWGHTTIGEILYAKAVIY